MLLDHLGLGLNYSNMDSFRPVATTQLELVTHNNYAVNVVEDGATALSMKLRQFF